MSGTYSFFIPYTLLRPKGINKFNKYCNNSVCYLSAIWNCRWKIWCMPKWACNAYLAWFCYAKNKAHINEWITAAIHSTSKTNRAAACMQQTRGWWPQVLICTQLHTSNSALVNGFLYFYYLRSTHNCLPYFIYVVNAKLLVIFQHWQDPGPQQ